MKSLILTVAILTSCLHHTSAQADTSIKCPAVTVTAKLIANTFSSGQDILVTIILTNKTNSTQSVWFDKPNSSIGGPAWTSVTLTNKKTGLTVLKYECKAILESQLYSAEDVKRFSHHLKPGEKISGQFNLLDLVVLLDYKQKLDKGDYDMQIFYCNNSSERLYFAVD